MRYKNFTFLIFLILTFVFSFAFHVAEAQTKFNTDTSKVYRKIETYSKQRKFTKFLYRLIFRPIAPKGIAPKQINNNPKILKYKGFEGKIIRRINIVTLDPFGYKVTDTNVAKLNVLGRTANKLHVKSRQFTIRNLLMIKKNRPFDSLLVKESERLIRSQSYVHDVLVYAQPSGTNSDSVDVFIRVLDYWSITPKDIMTTSTVKLELTDKNLAGLGHTFDNSYKWNRFNGRNAFYTSYFIPNYDNTYINTLINYQKDELNNYNLTLDIERPFYSPIARWAGGINVSRLFKKINFNPELNPVPNFVPLLYNTEDYWAAYAWKIFKGNTENDRTTHLVISARLLRVHYLQKPGESIDSLKLYSNENFFLSGIGISSRRYIKDRYVFNFGLTEDVPVGGTYGVIGGYQVKNNPRTYLGFYYSIGNYYKWGYFSGSLNYGTFFYNSKVQEGFFNAGINYFSNLFSIGSWKFRQFCRPSLTLAIKQLPSDSLTLNGKSIGISGFNSGLLKGTDRVTFSLQTQSYAPWKFLGFRFGPYFICSFGMLGNTNTGFRRSRVYSLLGVGTLIKNQYLIFNTFQISIAFYPAIPGDGSNVFKVNSFNNVNFSFNDFSIGKPSAFVCQ